MNEILQKDLEEIYNGSNIYDRLNGVTVLVTGPYGMLASYVVYFLLYLIEEKDYDTKIVAIGRSVDKFEAKYGSIENKPYIEFIKSDLMSEIVIDGPVDYIIHAASLANPSHYEVRPVDVMNPNIIGNYNLLQLAVKKNIKGYLLFSTGDIYGRVDGVKYITEADYGILDTLDLHNCYSESKRMAETMCKAFYQQYNVPVKIARIWHTYAPTMDIKNDPRVFSSFVNNIIDGKNIEMKSDGRGKRSFCYITDAVIGYFKILLEGEAGEAYNVCNESQFLSVAKLAENLVNLRPNKKLKVIHVQRSASEPYTENVLLKDKESIPSSEKLQKLGWKPKVNILEGFNRVLKYIESEIKNEEGKCSDTNLQ